MKQPSLIVANWKMQGSLSKNKALVLGILEKLKSNTTTSAETEIECVLCPPAVYLPQVAELLAGQQIKLGAQNAYCEPSGAYTGEIAPEMLQEIGCTYVILGHSERRTLFFETDELIARKFGAAYHAGLTPILCVGETHAEREAGSTFEVVARQINAVLNTVPIAAWEKAVIAYEPVWAIGTGLTATPEVAQAVHAFIRQCLAKKVPQCATSTRILYGGSVKRDNALSLFNEPDIDGGLIGGASLNAEEFVKICMSARVKSLE